MLTQTYISVRPYWATMGFGGFTSSTYWYDFNWRMSDAVNRTYNKRVGYLVCKHNYFIYTWTLWSNSKYDSRWYIWIPSCNTVLLQWRELSPAGCSASLLCMGSIAGSKEIPMLGTCHSFRHSFFNLITVTSQVTVNYLLAEWHWAMSPFLPMTEQRTCHCEKTADMIHLPSLAETLLKHT